MDYLTPRLFLFQRYQARAQLLDMNITCPVCDLSTLAILCNVSAGALQSSVDSDPRGGRTTWNILWSSLTTLFACTWIACHPNIPGLDETWLQKKAGRIKLFVAALLAPEIVIFHATRQWLAAREMGRNMRKFFKEHGVEVEARGVSSVIFLFGPSRASFPT